MYIIHKERVPTSHRCLFRFVARFTRDTLFRNQRLLLSSIRIDYTNLWISRKPHIKLHKTTELVQCFTSSLLQLFLRQVTNLGGTGGCRPHVIWFFQGFKIKLLPFILLNFFPFNIRIGFNFFFCMRQIISNTPFTNSFICNRILFCYLSKLKYSSINLVFF